MPESFALGLPYLVGRVLAPGGAGNDLQTEEGASLTTEEGAALQPES